MNSSTGWETTIALALAFYAFVILYFAVPKMRAEWKGRKARRDLNDSIVNRRLGDR